MVVLRFARCIFRHRAVRSGLFDFAPSASGQNGVDRSLAGGFSADAFVSGALCDERNARCRALATLTVYLCLRLLKNETPRAAQFVFVGLALGATMLTKATGILLLPIVIAAICARRVHARAPFAIWLRNLGLLIATCLAVCGWYYARIWLKFGTPLLGNWDVISGFTGGRIPAITQQLITSVSDVR